MGANAADMTSLVAEVTQYLVWVSELFTQLTHCCYSEPLCGHSLNRCGKCALAGALAGTSDQEHTAYVLGDWVTVAWECRMQAQHHFLIVSCSGFQWAVPWPACHMLPDITIDVARQRLIKVRVDLLVVS